MFTICEMKQKSLYLQASILMNFTNEKTPYRFENETYGFQI